MHSEKRVLTRTRVLMWVFPARSVPLPPVWHHRISLRLIVHTVPAACSLWTVFERRLKSTETKDCENMLLVLSFTASLWFDLIICATQQKSILEGRGSGISNALASLVRRRPLGLTLRHGASIWVGAVWWHQLARHTQKQWYAVHSNLVILESIHG